MTNIAGDFLNMDPRVHWSSDERLSRMRDCVELISDQKTRSLVNYTLSKSDAFWDAPVFNIKDGTYPEDEYEPGGLLRHTRRAVKSFVYLCGVTDFTLEEYDCAMAALILRNITRAIYIDKEHTQVMYDPFYLYTVENFIDNITVASQMNFEDNGSILGVSLSTINLIMRLIRTSDGRMSIVPETLPATYLEKMVHFATVMGSSCHDILNEPIQNDD